MHQISERERQIETLIRARYPYIYILSWEERRIEDLLRRLALRLGYRLYGWTVTQGITALDTTPKTDVDPGAHTALKALNFIEHNHEAALYLLKDFHPFLDAGPARGDPATLRKLRDLLRPLKESRKTVIFLSPVLHLPPEIEKDVVVVDYALPTTEELREALQRIQRSARAQGNLRLRLTPEEEAEVLRAAQGLTVNEAENVFAKSLVLKRRLDVEIIIAEKKQIIQKSQMLEYYESIEAIEYVGGMNALKAWLQKRRLAFSEQARAFGLPEPRGLLLLGVQGCGKSLLAKAVATLWQLPLLRLDMGRVFSEWVGASEQNMRRALQLAESVAPAILWVDEIEKGLAGLQSSGRSDAGTSARVMGSFLVWLQEKSAPVFVIATSNDISLLPPELLRKGRFDEIFFVDLPTLPERQEIFAIHLAKRHRDPRAFDLLRLAQASEGFSGAEIEQVIIDALYNAFDAQRDLTEEDILRSITQTLPLSRTMSDQITALRQWARAHARAASIPHPQTPPLP